MNHSRIMILSKDEALAYELGSYFRESKYGVDLHTSYSELITALLDGKNSPDLLLLDVGMPSWKEYDAIQRIREFSDVRILIISDDDRLENQLYAYTMKIDDYMIKPVALPLLEAHVEAILRRCSITRSHTATAGELVMDYDGRKVTLANQPLTLTAKEFDILAFLIEHQGVVLSRDKILDSVWGFDYVGSYRSVDTLIKNLRAKLTEQYPYIRTIYGVGYCFET